jgi:uncharacterized membrane protein YqiK
MCGFAGWAAWISAPAVRVFAIIVAVYIFVGIVWIFWPRLRQRFANRFAKPS